MRKDQISQLFLQLVHVYKDFGNCEKEKKEKILLSSTTKASIPTENSKTQRGNTKKTPQNISITQRLRTDFWRSFWVTAVTQLVFIG